MNAFTCFLKSNTNFYSVDYEDNKQLEIINITDLSDCLLFVLNNINNKNTDNYYFLNEDKYLSLIVYLLKKYETEIVIKKPEDYNFITTYNHLIDKRFKLEIREEILENKYFYSSYYINYLYPVKDYIDNWYIKDLFENEFLSVYEVIYYFNLYHSLNNSYKQVLNEIFKYKKLTNLILFNKNYLTNLTKNWKDKLNGLNKLITEHKINHIFNNKNSLNDIINQYDIISKVIKKSGLEIIGILENKKKLNGVNYEQALNLINKNNFSNNMLLTIPAKLPDLVGGWIVIELLTRSQLIEEGNYQSHCVGGKASNILNKDYKVFSFRKKGIRQTVAYFFSNDRWRIHQSTSKFNQEPKCSLADKSFLKSNEQIILESLNSSHKKFDKDDLF